MCVFQEDELKKSVLCVFANKQDIEGSMTVTEVANALGLSAIKNRRYQIFKTSAIKGEGLDEAMEWYVVIVTLCLYVCVSIYIRNRIRVLKIFVFLQAR